MPEAARLTGRGAAALVHCRPAFRQGRSFRPARRSRSRRHDARQPRPAWTPRWRVPAQRGWSSWAISCMRVTAARPSFLPRWARGVRPTRAWPILLVRGNHDDRAGDPPDDWGIDCREEPLPAAVRVAPRAGRGGRGLRARGARASCGVPLGGRRTERNPTVFLLWSKTP